MSTKQKNVIEFVRANPGCCIMDVVKSEWSGRGHVASYARVNRLVKNGALIAKRNQRGGRVALTVAETV